MRVVAGKFKGRRLQSPRGSARPTADRVREAIFSILGPLEGVRALDLFAGSGALGIEALSRGAADAVFVDSDRVALETVRANLALVRAEALVVADDALRFLERAGLQDSAHYGLVFLDPPYSSAGLLAERLSELLPGLLTADARVVTESDKRRPLLIDLPIQSERSYGDTRIAIHNAARPQDRRLSRVV